MLVFVLLEIVSGSKQTGQRLSKPKPEPVAKFAKLVHRAFMQGIPNVNSKVLYCLCPITVQS